VEVREVSPGDRRALKRFVTLERRFLGDQAQHVSETDSDAAKRLSGRSAFSEGVAHELLVAANGAPVARCAAIVNPRYQERHGDPHVGFIGYLAAAPGEEEAVVRMLERAEEWLAHRGIERVVAPFNEGAVVGMAALTADFGDSPMFPLAWNPPYYRAYLEAAGYEAAFPFWVYEINLSSERYRQASARALENPSCVVRTVDKKRWREEIETLRLLFNEGFRDEWEMHEYTSAEFAELWGPMKPVFDERMLLFAEVDGEPAGFCFGVPDWTPLWRSFRGRMGPVQILRLLRRAKRFDRAGLLGIAVLPSRRGMQIGATLAATLYRGFEEMGVGKALYYLVNDHNTASRGLAASFGGEGRVPYHCFEKRLS
jgi:GNAT superfamily N-acetyltransferase